MKTQALLTICFIGLLSCTSPQPKPAQVRQTPIQAALKVPTGPVNIVHAKPADVVNLHSVTNKVQVKMAYASADNFTAAVVPGYLANHCYLQQKAAAALAKVALQAERLGYQLQVLDCYRPQRASDYFMAWVADTKDQTTKASYYPRLEKKQLSPGYIAAHSGHSRASTVDLTLLRKNAAGQWHPLDMGGQYDVFDPVSHLNSTAISAQQKANRLLLKDLMQQQSFIPYELEWWHFTLDNEAYPNSYFDFVVN